MPHDDGIGLPLPWGIIPAERIFRVVTGADPAAGAEVSVAVPGGVVWVVQSVTFGLVTDATVINRGVRLELTDGSTVYAVVAPGEFQAASADVRWSYLRGFGAQGSLLSGVGKSMPFPDVPMLGGHVIRTNTLNLQAGDNYGAPTLYVAEYSLRGLERGRARYLEALVEAGA